MPNILFSLTISILSLHFFTITYRTNGINRALFNLPISIFETSIPLINGEGEFEPYFAKNILEDKLTYYFDTNLLKYTDRYTVSYYYFNQEDYSICRDEKCQAIEINLKADIVLNYKYNKTATFYIRSNIDG